MTNIACGFGFAAKGGAAKPVKSVFYLDEIRFEGEIAKLKNAPVLLRSYDTDNLYIQNAAFTYDNALAAMAFLSCGCREEAKQILDAFVYAVQNDRAEPGRIRNAYAAGDLTPFSAWKDGARLPGWYDADGGLTGAYYEDRYQAGSNVGNTSYAALALLQYDALYGEETFRETAETLMRWVLTHCADGAPGFTAGFDGWTEGGEAVTYPFTYKSIEHNIDAFAAFSRLYALTENAEYLEAARSARTLIESLYDADAGLFYTGTLDDGVTPNTANLVLDAQVWSALALGAEFAPCRAALSAAEDMRVAGGGYPFCKANANGGWWAEGTAFTALAFRLFGREAQAREALDALCAVQLASGAFPAATVEALSTGFALFTGESWDYGNDPHIAPTAWFVMAVNGFNPYDFAR